MKGEVKLTEAQRLALKWIHLNRCSHTAWIGPDGYETFWLDGPDGDLSISPGDQISLRPFYEPNPEMVPGQDCRMWRLTPAGRIALGLAQAQEGGTDE